MPSIVIYLLLVFLIGLVIGLYVRIGSLRQQLRMTEERAANETERANRWKSYCDDDHVVWSHSTSTFLLDNWPDELLVLVKAGELKQIRHSPPYLPPPPLPLQLTDAIYDDSIKDLVENINRIAEGIRNGSSDDPIDTSCKVNAAVEHFRNSVENRH